LAPENSIISPGGKGVNIAITLQYMGLQTLAMGFGGGTRGRALTQMIRQEGVSTNFVFTAGETRTDISIFDRLTNTLTEINEPGMPVPEDEINLFLENYKKALCQTNIMILAGSIPPKVPNNLYAELVQLAHKKNIKTIVHTSPKFIEYAIEAEASIINPDMRSSHELFGKPLDGIDEFVRSGKEILSKRQKTELVLFSHRIENIVAITRDKTYILRPQNLKIKNMLGYGDAVVAGLAYSMRNDKNMRESLIFAGACGLTNVESLEKQMNDMEKIKSNFSRIEVEEI
jgi:1-phosphofructokinase family hexose kinase